MYFYKRYFNKTVLVIASNYSKVHWPFMTVSLRFEKHVS